LVTEKQTENQKKNLAKMLINNNTVITTEDGNQSINETMNQLSDNMTSNNNVDGLMTDKTKSQTNEKYVLWNEVSVPLPCYIA